MKRRTKRKSLLGPVAIAGLFVCLVLGAAAYLGLSFLETRLPSADRADEAKPLPRDPALAGYSPLDGCPSSAPLPLVRAAVSGCTGSSDIFVYAPPGDTPVLVYVDGNRSKSFPLPGEQDSLFSLACLTHAVAVWAEGESGVNAYALHMEIESPVLQHLGRIVDYPTVFTSGTESRVTATPFGGRDARMFRFVRPFTWKNGEAFAAPEWPRYRTPDERAAVWKTEYPYAAPEWPEEMGDDRYAPKANPAFPAADFNDLGGDGVPLLSRLVCRGRAGTVTASAAHDAKGAPYLYLEEDGSETELFFRPTSAVCYGGDALFYGEYDNAPVLAGVLAETPPLHLQRKDALHSRNASTIGRFTHSIWLLDPLSIACPPYGLPFLLPEGYEPLCDLVTSSGNFSLSFRKPAPDFRALRYGTIFRPFK